MDQRVNIAPRYLSVEDQDKLMAKFLNHVEYGPRKEVILNRYGVFITWVPSVANTLVFWNAGFKGYGLRRFARGRTITVMLPILTAICGPAYAYAFGFNSLIDAYRRENSLYYGLRFATLTQFTNLTTASSSILLTFIYATRNGVLLVPTTKTIFNIPVDAYGLMFSRLKPYRYSLLTSWIGCTAFMFVLGVASYNESCKIIRERFGRQTFSLVEEA